MALDNWNAYATLLAMTARQNTSLAPRGVLSIDCPGERTPVVGVFGNDNYAEDKRVKREVDLIRYWLTVAALEEVGFGLSQDGFTWALLVKVNDQRYQTVAGKAFQMEMVKLFLEDVVREAWSKVSDPDPQVQVQ